MRSIFIFIMALVFTTQVFAAQKMNDNAGTNLGFAKVLQMGSSTKSGLNCSKGATPADVATCTINYVDLGAVTTFAAADTTPSVLGGSWFNTDTGTSTITAFDDGVAGQVITVVSKGAVTIDVTSTTIKCGSTDIITAANDSLTLLFDGTNWICLARHDLSDDMN
jgi:hypothetical protein